MIEVMSFLIIFLTIYQITVHPHMPGEYMDWMWWFHHHDQRSHVSGRSHGPSWEWPHRMHRASFFTAITSSTRSNSFLIPESTGFPLRSGRTSCGDLVFQLIARRAASTQRRRVWPEYHPAWCADNPRWWYRTSSHWPTSRVWTRRRYACPW